MLESLLSVIISDIKKVIEQARLQAYRQVNTLAVLSNFEIGRVIVEHEQQGETRAPYGKETLKEISLQLTQEFGKGYSADNLELMRLFYSCYSDKISLQNSETLSRKSANLTIIKNSETLSRIFTGKTSNPFRLSWSHYVELIKMEEAERHFYELEAINGNWSVRELRRQYNSSLFERLALSKDKEQVRKLSLQGQIIDKPSDLIKQSYILDFLALKEESAYTESELEQAIIDKIEHFLLELGKGFLFEARQKRISLEGDNFFIDLVFYNRLLRCFVLIDLKIGKLTHKDIGQMQMYVNYYDRKVRKDNENPTLGIILCKQTNKSVVEFTLGEEQKNIFPREYKLYIPDKEELKKQLEQFNI